MYACCYLDVSILDFSKSANIENWSLAKLELEGHGTLSWPVKAIAGGVTHQSPSVPHQEGVCEPQWKILH